MTLRVEISEKYRYKNNYRVESSETVGFIEFDNFYLLKINKFFTIRKNSY